MFDFLKKKITGFIENLTKKEAAGAGVPAAPLPGAPDSVAEPVESAGIAKPAPGTQERPAGETEGLAAGVEEPEPVPEKKAPRKEEAPPKKETAAIPRQETEAPARPKAATTTEAQELPEAKPAPPKPKPVPLNEAGRRAPTASSGVSAHSAVNTQNAAAFWVSKSPKRFEHSQLGTAASGGVANPVGKAAQKPETKKEGVAPPGGEKQRIRLGAISAIKSFITSEVEITEGDVRGLLDDLELELLEADVDISVAGAIREELGAKLVGARAPRSGLHPFVGAAIRDTLEAVMANDKAFDIVERVNACGKPARIMFVGINGSGKTTTIAKVAKLLMDNGCKVLFAAADTFRAAAIEQMAVHADRLGVKMIKRDYGSDPTSVAYDAVNYARAHGIDVVLIDTAGRQDTNASLLNEMKKMVRVIQPDMKIYVGESIAGNAIIEQVSSFNREIGIDAVILTKLDCDAKGGTMLSINRATGIPVIYVGVGQGYGDLEKFDAARIAARIVE